MNRKLLIAKILIVLVVLPPLAKVAIDVYEHETFVSLRHEGRQRIREFETHRRENSSAHVWADVVETVATSWGSTFVPGKMKIRQLREALAELQRLADTADADNAVRRLDQILDLLLRYRPDESHFIEGMRRNYRAGVAQLESS